MATRKSPYTQYARGYQDALAEVLAKWQDEGVEAALNYIHANLSSSHPQKGL